MNHFSQKTLRGWWFLQLFLFYTLPTKTDMHLGSRFLSPVTLEGGTFFATFIRPYRSMNTWEQFSLELLKAVSKGFLHGPFHPWILLLNVHVSICIKVLAQLRLFIFYFMLSLAMASEIHLFSSCFAFPFVLLIVYTPCRYQIPEDWPYKEARQLFKEPLVTADYEQLEIKWTGPDEEVKEIIFRFYNSSFFSILEPLK